MLMIGKKRDALHFPSNDDVDNNDAHRESVKIFSFLSFYQIPRVSLTHSEAEQRERVREREAQSSEAKAIYLLEI
jgi:hypothetical protein